MHPHALWVMCNSGVVKIKRYKREEATVRYHEEVVA